MELASTPTRLLKILEVCERTALSRSTIYRAISEGNLKETRYGRSVRISSEELDRFLNSLSGKPQFADEIGESLVSPRVAS